MEAETVLVKSEQGDRRIVRGYASTAGLDQDGETILQNGIDFRPLVKSGYINADHQNRKIAGVTVPVIIGFPTNVELRDKGLWVEGELLKAHPESTPTEELKLADYFWEIGQQFQKSGSDRRLAYSIEGGITERRGKKIVKSVARAVALTWKPVNQECTVEFFRKSLCCGKCHTRPDLSCQEVHQIAEEIVGEIAKSEPATFTAPPNALSTINAKPILKQNLDRGMSGILYGDGTCDHIYKSTGRFRDGIAGAVDHLCKCQGHEKQDSINFMRQLMEKATNSADIAALVKHAGFTAR
jgi:hypothetical protein